MKRYITGALALTLALGFALSASAQSDSKKKMAMPKKEVISGVLVDMSCAAKGQKLMGSDHNALNDTHMTPKGKMESCATMCLKGGQPAGIYNDGKIAASLLANPSITLYKFASKEVEVEGWYAGNKKDKVKTFFPERIRLKGTKEWTKVVAAEMH